MGTNETINYSRMALTLGIIDIQKCKDFLDQHFGYDVEINANTLEITSNENGETVYSYEALDNEDLLGELQEFCIDSWDALKQNNLSPDIIRETECNEVIECAACYNPMIKKEGPTYNGGQFYCDDCIQDAMDCDESMKDNWTEINTIIQERSSKMSYMPIPNEMTQEDLSKVQFLLNEVNSFPDNQKTVVESGELFRKHLSTKYGALSPDSISRLVYRFCFLNR